MAAMQGEAVAHCLPRVPIARRSVTHTVQAYDLADALLMLDMSTNVVRCRSEWVDEFPKADRGTRSF